MAKRKKSKGKGAAAGDEDSDVAPPTGTTQTVGTFTGAKNSSKVGGVPEVLERAGKGIPVVRACQIADAGANLASELALLQRRESKTAEILKKIRSEISEKTATLVGLWDDERTGQTHLALVPDEDDEAKDTSIAKATKAPPEVAEGKRTPGKAEALRFVSGYGERSLAVQSVAAGEWLGFIDGKPCEARDRSAQEAMNRVLEDLAIPQKRWATWSWEADAWTPPAGGHFAEYRGRRLSVTKAKDGLWQATCKTGIAVQAVSNRTYEDPADAMEDALGMAGYDERDARPKWSATPPEGDQGKPAEEIPEGAQLVAEFEDIRVTLKRDHPGPRPHAWTGRVDGKPIAIDLPLEQARAETEKYFAKEYDVVLVWKQINPDAIAKAKKA